MKRIMKEQTLIVPVRKVQVPGRAAVCDGPTYRQITLNRMTRPQLKMLAIPRAKQRTTQRMPVLESSVR